MMTVEMMGNKLSVSYQKIHHGHDDNIGRLNMTPKERLVIAEKLRLGVPIDKVLDDIRDNARDCVSAINMLDMKDLHNIKRDFGLFEGRYDPDDFTSVHKFVEVLKKQDDNPIRFYRCPKVQEEAENRATSLLLVLSTDFQLDMLLKLGDGERGVIFLDSTHGTNSYNYQLTTIVVMDEFGNGLPTAFCLSSDSSAIEWETFFNVIKEAISKKTKCEKKIQPRAFMTDNDPSFYNAWAKVMGEIPNRLLCAWHIDQAWRRNLGKVG